MSKIVAMTVSAGTSSRRSQAERSATTRDALLDATIACLVEDGYANTTTSRVAERAGVSRGAHLHHFQTRRESARRARAERAGPRPAVGELRKSAVPGRTGVVVSGAHRPRASGATG